MGIGKTKWASGFSLIEMAVVLGIILILAAFAVPNIAKSLPKYRLKGAARQVAGMVQQARLKAIKSGVIQFLIVDFGSISPSPIGPGGGPPVNYADNSGVWIQIGSGQSSSPVNAGQVRIIQDDFPSATPLTGDFFAGDAVPIVPDQYNPYPSANWPFITCCQNDVTVDPECVNLGGPFCAGTDSLSPYDMVDFTSLPGNDDYKNVIISQVTDGAGNNLPLPNLGGAVIGNGPVIVFDVKGFTCLAGNVPLGGLSCNPQNIQSVTAIIFLQETIGGARASVSIFGSGGFAVEMVGQAVL